MLPGEISTSPLVKTMKAFAVGFISAVSFAAIVTVPLLVRHIEQATIEQCRTQDWPAAQAEEHIEFCLTYVR